MAPLRLVVVNDRNVAKELERQGPLVVSAMDAVIKRGVLRISNRIVKTLQKGSRSGRSYPRPGGQVHVASAPGEPPKSDTGFLAQHVVPTTTKNRSGVISAAVVISASYAGFLEFGTTHMKPRPYVKPAFLLELPAIRKDATKAIKRAIK